MMNFFTSPEGSYFLGNEVRRPPSTHLQYIKEYILSKRRFNTIILSDSKYPEMENALRMENQGGYGVNVKIDAAITKLEYRENGYIFEENISCGIVEANMMYGHTSWVADKIISTRTLKGKLEEKGKIFSIMLESFKFNLNWFNLYHQYVQALSQNTMQSINNAMIISRIITKNNNDI